MTDPIEFDAEPDEGDYRDAARLVTRGRRWLIPTIYLAVAATLAGVSLLDWRRTGDDPTGSLLFAGILAGMPLVLWWVARRHLGRVFRRNPMFGVRRRVTLGEDEYAEAATLWRTAVDWRAFTQFRETPRQFLLFRGQHLFHMLPKRDIESALGDGGVDAVRDRLAARLKADDPRPGFEVVL